MLSHSEQDQNLILDQRGRPKLADRSENRGDTEHTRTRERTRAAGRCWEA